MILQRTYAWLDDMPLAQIDRHGKAVPMNETVAYLHSDHLGTPRMATDSSQQVVWRGDSDAFGAKSQDDIEDDSPDDDSKIVVNLRFPGQYFDKETRLHYNWNRYYDPGTGRYISSDPIGLGGGINTYTYVGGNPISKIDPLGLAEICSKFWHPHTFLCVGESCSGKYPAGNPYIPFYDPPGEINDDSKNKSSASCSDVPNGKCDQKSFDQCVAKRIANRGSSGDRYNYSTSNCGQWAEDVIQQCRNECTKK